MFDSARVIEIIDRAYEAQRFCDACGSPTVLLSIGESVILACSASPPDSVFARIVAYLIPHTRRVVIDLTEELAA